MINALLSEFEVDIRERNLAASLELLKTIIRPEGISVISNNRLTFYIKGRNPPRRGPLSRRSFLETLSTVEGNL